jgi:hypothetical protein
MRAEATATPAEPRRAAWELEVKAPRGRSRSNGAIGGPFSFDLPRQRPRRA